jgi:hypothetical protein
MVQIHDIGAFGEIIQDINQEFIFVIKWQEGKECDDNSPSFLYFGDAYEIKNYLRKGILQILSNNILAIITEILFFDDINIAIVIYYTPYIKTIYRLFNTDIYKEIKEDFSFPIML